MLRTVTVFEDLPSLFRLFSFNREDTDEHKSSGSFGRSEAGCVFVQMEWKFKYDTLTTYAIFHVPALHVHYLQKFDMN